MVSVDIHRITSPHVDVDLMVLNYAHKKLCRSDDNADMKLFPHSKTRHRSNS